MQNKIDRVNERLEAYFKDNCSACTHNTYNIDGDGDCELEMCNFEMNEYTKGLIDGINDILYEQLPERCANPYTANNCRICAFNIDDESKDYDYFFPSPCKDNGCLNYEKKENEK